MKELWLLIIISKHGGKAVLSVDVPPGEMQRTRAVFSLIPTTPVLFLKDGACFSCTGVSRSLSLRRAVWVVDRAPEAGASSGRLVAFSGAVSLSVIGMIRT